MMPDLLNGNCQFVQMRLMETQGDKTSIEHPFWTRKLDANYQGLQAVICQHLGINVTSIPQDKAAPGCIFAFTDNCSLADPWVYRELVQPGGTQSNQLRAVADFGTRQLAHRPYFPKPIISIGPDDIMELQRPGTGEAAARAPRIAFINALKQRLDPRFRFFDGSIWHRYLSVFPAETFLERLKRLYETVVENYARGLYHSIVGREYLEFQCRKLLNSYILSEREGHARKVTPFRFHSESKMAVRTQAELWTQLSDFRFGCVLVDDYANQALRTLENPVTSTTSPSCTKQQLIAEILSPGSTRGGGQTEDLVQILNVNEKPLPEEGYVSFGLRMLKKYPTDILILDYFFGMDEKDPEQQYGHKLIARIPTEAAQQHEGISSLNGKIWIYTISAFEFAFQSHLRMMGSSAAPLALEILEGADPVNTPELFRYLFYRFLIKYRVAAGADLKAGITQFLAKVNWQKLKPDDFRLLVKERTPALMDLFVRFGHLRQYGSVFSQSIKAQHQKMEPLIQFLDLLLEVANLLSLGRPAQIVQMWRAYHALVQVQNYYIADPGADLPDVEGDDKPDGLPGFLSKTREYLLSPKFTLK